MPTRTVNPGTAYPAAITTDENGTVTGIAFTCAAHGNDASCQDCADREAAEFQTARIYPAYVQGRNAVTFGGFPLARITAKWNGQRRYTPSGGTYRMTYVNAVSHDGTVRWHGKYNGDTTNLVFLRRNRS